MQRRCTRTLAPAFVPTLVRLRVSRLAPWLLALLVGLPHATVHAQAQVRIGVQNRIVHGVLALAQARGDFEAAGVRVQLVGPPSPLQALLDDELDLLAITAEALITAERDGVDLRGALLLGEARGADVLFGEPGLQSAAGFRGARVGVVPGASGRLLLAAELQRRGLALDDVQLETLSVGEAIRRWLAPGDAPPLQAVVAAAPASVLFEDAVTQADALARSGHPVVRLGDGRRGDGLISDVLAGEERWLRDNKASVKAVIRGWNRTIAALRSDPQASLTRLAELSGADVDVLQRSLDGVELFGVEDNIRLLRGDFQKRFSSMSRVLARTRRERARGVPSANRYLSLAALRQVAAGR